MKHGVLRMLALLKFAKVHTDENESDILAEPMTKERMIKLATKLGLNGGPHEIHDNG